MTMASLQQASCLHGYHSMGQSGGSSSMQFCCLWRLSCYHVFASLFLEHVHIGIGLNAHYHIWIPGGRSQYDGSYTEGIPIAVPRLASVIGHSTYTLNAVRGLQITVHER